MSISGLTSKNPKIVEFIQKLYNLNEYELVLFVTGNKIKAVKWSIENSPDIF